MCWELPIQRLFIDTESQQLPGCMKQSTLSLFLADGDFAEKAKIGGIQDAFQLCDIGPHCTKALVRSGYDLPKASDSFKLFCGRSFSPISSSSTPPGEEGESVHSLKANMSQDSIRFKSTMSNSSSDPSSMHSFGISSHSIENATSLKWEKVRENLVDLVKDNDEDDDIEILTSSKIKDIININLPTGTVKHGMTPKEFLDDLNPRVVVERLLLIQRKGNSL